MITTLRAADDDGVTSASSGDRPAVHPFCVFVTA
jgi:hypothetical protein